MDRLSSADEEIHKAPLFYKLHSIRSRYEDDSPIKKELVMKLIERGYVENINTNNIDIKDIIKYNDYNNPYNYTDHQKYMTDFISLDIKNKLGMSFIEYINMDMHDFIRTNTICEMIKDQTPDNSEDDITKEIDTLQGVINGFEKDLH